MNKNYKESFGQLSTSNFICKANILLSVITDHQALISALNASERSKRSPSRLTRWIDRLIPFHFNIKHLAESKMGLIDYMSRNPVRIM